MTSYVAFLRGVNVGGHTMVKTSDICRGLVARGYGKVKGYKQSGNIVFDTNETDSDTIVGDIQAVIDRLINKRVEVFLRTMDYVREIVRLEPFRGVTGDVKLYVTFLHREPVGMPALPFRSPEGDSEFILALGREVYGIAYPEDGRYGASYGKIVEKFGKPNTSRDWNTVKGIATLPDR
jgi:uncharacterized protein (DUF1697 family)